MRCLLALVPLLVACTTNFNRAALVPHATPRMTSGQQLETRGQLTLGASSVAHLGDPEPGTSNQGVELPGTQLFGALKGRIGDVFTFGLIYENGLDAGAKKLNSSQPDVDNGNVQGYGLTLDFAIPTGDPRLKIGVGIDAVMWSCPYVSYETTTGGAFTIREEGTDTVGTFAASITPSFKLDSDLTVFGGLTVRQHPTIDQKGMGQLLDDVDVQSGPANYIVSGGVELTFANGNMKAAAMAYYDVSRDPAKYGPGMAVMLSVPFGRRDPAPQQQPIYAPPYGPPPGYPQPGPYAPPPQPYPPQPGPIAPAPEPPIAPAPPPPDAPAPDAPGR